MNNISINGKIYKTNSRNITVYCDGEKIEENLQNEVTIRFEGDLANLKSDGKVEVYGNVSGNIDCGGSFQCSGNITGDIDAGGSVTCGDVNGDIDAGGSVKYIK